MPLQIPKVRIFLGQQHTTQTSTCRAHVPNRNSPTNTKNKHQVEGVRNEDLELLS